MKLTLPPDIMRAIQAHATRAYPLEAAGLLIGHDKPAARLVVEAAPLENSFDPQEQGHRYSIDPRAMIEMERQADEAGLTIVGVYHSHPDHPALPSEFDRRNAWPWLVYIITSINAGAAGESRAWLLDDDRREFKEVELVIDYVSEEKV